MNNILKLSIALLLCTITPAVFAWGACGLDIQGSTQVCVNQTVNLLAMRTGGDELGVCSWSNTPGIAAGAKTIEGCEATFTGTQAGDFWVTAYYQKYLEYKCHDVTKITVTQNNNGGGCGCEIQSIEGTPDVILPRQINGSIPDGSNESVIVVTMSYPAPPGGCTIEFNLEANYRGSGGHTHDTGDAPLGDLSSQLLLIPEGDATGTTVYKSPYVAGEVIIKANVQGAAFVTGNQKIIANGVFGMLELIENTNDFRFTGVRAADHSVSHTATENININIASAAQAYKERSGATLGLNDMSIPDGGLFDYTGSWNPPHGLHRKGTSVDIDQCARVVTCPPGSNPNCNFDSFTCAHSNGNRYRGYINVTNGDAADICSEAGGFRWPEDTHHCELTDAPLLVFDPEPIPDPRDPIIPGPPPPDDPILF